MSKLIMLSGLPASGKSTLAKELQEKENAVIVSSDEMRAELFGDINSQENNTELFKKAHERINGFLNEGKTVIYDATNINRKRRIHFINNEIKADEKVIYYMNTPFNSCVENDANRERTVGYEVIDKMYRNMHIPTMLEGWDEVVFVGDDKVSNTTDGELLEKYLTGSGTSHDELFLALGEIVKEFNDIYNVSQDSSYHSFSISRHTYHVFKYIKDSFTEYKGAHYKELLVAALFHDTGKAHCKSFYNYKGEEKRFASFISHENVSAQIACENLTLMGYSDDFIKYVIDLVQFHMYPMKISEKTEKRLRNLLTDEQYKDLMFLHVADISAK